MCLVQVGRGDAVLGEEVDRAGHTVTAGLGYVVEMTALMVLRRSKEPGVEAMGRP